MLQDPNGVPVVTAALIYTKPAVLRLAFIGRDSVVIAGANPDPRPDQTANSAA